MKIGIDARSLMDERYSGVSEYALNLINTILRLDRENEYRLFYNSARDISNRIPKFNYPNVEIIKKNIPNKIFNWPMQKILGWPKIDKILDSDIFISPNISPIAVSKSNKKILIIHDLSFLRFPEFYNFKRNLWHKLIDVKSLIKKFDHIIAVSENTKNDIINLCGVNPEKVEIIYSGVESGYKKLNSENSEFSQVIKKYKLPDKFILFLGTLEPRKNLEGLIRAYNRFRDENIGLGNYKLIIAGGKGWKSGNIYNEWKKSKYNHDIKFLGYVDKNDKIYLYNLASLFVYPSFYEGFGFPPLEAMACGVPVITSFTSSLPEITNNASLMVDPFDISDIARAIEEVIKNKELSNDLVQKGYINAKKFNWENTARKYLDLFKN